MAEADQTAGAGKTAAEVLYSDSKASAPEQPKATPTESLTLAEVLYGKDPAKESPKEPTEVRKPGDWLKEAADRSARENIPENYQSTLKLPEGTPISETLMPKFEELAKESGLTAERAQRFADLHLEAVAEVIRENSKSLENRRAEVDGWAEQFKADPDFGGAKTDESVGAALKVLDDFGTPEEVQSLRTELNSTGMGSNPILIRGLVRVARRLGYS